MNPKEIMQIFADNAYVRTGGSQEELRCAEYIREKCAQMGLQAQIMPFPVDMATIQEATLTVDGQEVTCKGYLCAGSAEVEAPFYYLRDTSAVSLAQCKGKIVMIDGYLGYWKYHDLLDNGAVGFITYDGNINYADEDIDQRELRSYVSKGEKIPGVNINAKAAMELIRKGSKNAKITLKQEEYTGESRNVILDMPGEVDEVIRHADISQQSKIRTVQLLGKAAKAQGKRHKVVLMVDMGDLREGVFFQNRDDLFALAAAVLEEEALELYGVGVNLSCFGGILPDETNLGGLVEAAEAIREKFGVPLPFVSGGNTSSVSMLLEGRIPKGITNLRIGEGILLGNDTSGLKPIPLYHRDCFTLEAELAEVKIKPSKPIGPVGTNAFGEVVEFPDRGIMKRGILAIGRQDVFPDDLTPRDGEVEILGASSDHLIVNLTDAKRDYKVGDILSFDVNYGALLRLCTSEYVKRTYKTTDRSAVKV